MEHSTKQNLFKIIIILSIIGLITSVYLIKNHYLPSGEGSWCDFNRIVSCSTAEASNYSELWSVPVAVWGAIWFIFLMALAWKSLKKQGELTAFMLSWLILGFLFVIYMVIAELILKIICPLCTLLHLIIVFVLILGILLYKALEDPSHKSFMKIPSSWFRIILIVNVIILIIFNFFPQEKQNYDQLAHCLTERGVVLYSSFRCGVCIKSEEMFGEAVKFLKRVECHPQGENAQTEICIGKSVTGTPTWILEPGGKEIKRHVGFMSVEELKEFAGCK